MSQLLNEYEGTWEDILARSHEFAGRHVQIKIVAPPVEAALSSKQQQMLNALEEIQQTEYTPEEIEMLEGFAAFQKEHPFRLRPIEDTP